MSITTDELKTYDDFGPLENLNKLKNFKTKINSRQLKLDLEKNKIDKYTENFVLSFLKTKKKKF